jgi:predicted acetyltransferase
VTETPDEKLELVLPDLSLREDFLEMCREYLVHGNPHERMLFGRALSDFAGYVQQCRNDSAGIDLELDQVPQTTFWLVRDGERIVAMSRLRHELTPHLLHEGGHIGYGTRPSERGRGYGKIICAKTLIEAREAGIDPVLITCDDGNVASAKIIEANGGVLENTVIARENGRPRRRYWVHVGPPRGNKQP